MQDSILARMPCELLQHILKKCSHDNALPLLRISHTCRYLRTQVYVYLHNCLDNRLCALGNAMCIKYNHLPDARVMLLNLEHNILQPSNRYICSKCGGKTHALSSCRWCRRVPFPMKRALIGPAICSVALLAFGMFVSYARRVRRV